MSGVSRRRTLADVSQFLARCLSAWYSQGRCCSSQPRGCRNTKHPERLRNSDRFELDDEETRKYARHTNNLRVEKKVLISIHPATRSSTLALLGQPTKTCHRFLSFSYFGAKLGPFVVQLWNSQGPWEYGKLLPEVNSSTRKPSPSPWYSFRPGKWPIVCTFEHFFLFRLFSCRSLLTRCEELCRSSCFYRFYRKKPTSSRETRIYSVNLKLK